MALNTFFSRHPIFTTAELSDFLKRNDSVSVWTRKALLAHHEEHGHIVRLRRGLYAAVPPGVEPTDVSIDPHLVASKLASDAVLAYHTALEFHGKAHSLLNRFFYLTEGQPRPFSLRSYAFKAVSVPKVLRAKGRQDVGIETRDRSGVDVRVTTLERTLVDTLDRPDLGGGWEEVWRSLESVEFFAIDRVVEYALLLDNATTVAKVGYFLDQHRERLMIEEGHLDALKSHRPSRPHYLDRKGPSKGRLAADWNLIVPTYIAERAWEEVP